MIFYHFFSTKPLSTRAEQKTTKYLKRPYIDINEMTLRELVLRPSSGIGLKCLLDGKQCQTVFCTVAKVQNLAID